MRSHEDSFSLLRDYFGLDRRTLLIFVALVVGVLVVVTGIYVAIFGFQKWKTNMEHAGSLMVANFDTPATGPAEGNIEPRAIQPGTPRYVPAAAPVPAQYVCPNCGAVGLPRWSPSGSPLCPNCGRVVRVAGRRGTNVQLVARP